jgi:nucleoside-diphosphate-sugar epimerase
MLRLALRWRAGVAMWAGGQNAWERMKVALIGGTGFVGSYLVDELIRQAHDPVLLVRPGSEPKVRHADQCAIISGDVTDPGSEGTRSGGREVRSDAYPHAIPGRNRQPSAM